MNTRRFVLILLAIVVAWAAWVYFGAKRRGVAPDLSFKVAVESYGKPGAGVAVAAAALLAWLTD